MHLEESNHDSDHGSTDEARGGDEATGTSSRHGGRAGSLIARASRNISAAARDGELGGGVRARSGRASLGGSVASRVEGGLGRGSLLGGADGRSADDSGKLVAGGVDNRLVDAGGRGNVDRGGGNLGRSSRSGDDNLGRGCGTKGAVGHSRVALSKSDNPGSGRGECCGIQNRSRRSVVLSSGDRGASGGNHDAGELHGDGDCWWFEKEQW